MSDYFDALIRASGLAAERPAAAAGSDPTAVDPDADVRSQRRGWSELDVEHVAAPVERVDAPVRSHRAAAGAGRTRQRPRPDPERTCREYARRCRRASDG